MSAIFLVLLQIALAFAIADAICRLVVGRSLPVSLRLLFAGGSEAGKDEAGKDTEQSELERLVARRREELEHAEREAELARQASDLADRLDAALETLDDAERRLADAEAKLAVTAELGDHAAIERGKVSPSATHAR
ncbi:MAG: hypothetical protein AAGC60_08555 [Acidobacteriota bacterium]